MGGTDEGVRLGVPIVQAQRTKLASCGHRTAWRLAIVIRGRVCLHLQRSNYTYCPICRSPSVDALPNFVQSYIHEAGWPL